MILGLMAGVILGFYDYWTKKATSGNNVISVVFWSSLFGALAWFPAFIPILHDLIVFPKVEPTTLVEQIIIFPKTIAMTLSWLLAYYSARELPLSYSGAVRASGPILTFAGGAIVFGESLSSYQFTAILISVLAYYFLSSVGKQEGIILVKNKAVFMMLVATALSVGTTVYDKYMVSSINLSIYSIQAYSAIHRCLLAFLILVIFGISSKKWSLAETWRPAKWTIYIPLVGLSWVAAEAVHFLALTDPAASVTYLSVFRRMSLVVGFALSAMLLGERHLIRKSICVCLILFSTLILIITN